MYYVFKSAEGNVFDLKPFNDAKLCAQLSPDKESAIDMAKQRAKATGIEWFVGELVITHKVSPQEPEVQELDRDQE